MGNVTHYWSLASRPPALTVCVCTLYSNRICPVKLMQVAVNILCQFYSYMINEPYFTPSMQQLQETVLLDMNAQIVLTVIIHVKPT